MIGEHAGCGRKLRKSERSGNTNCVTAGSCRCHQSAIGDTKDPDGPELQISNAAFTAFLGGIKAGAFVRP